MELHGKGRRRAQRHERKRQLLGHPNPTCATCGHDVVAALQLHHVAGEANGGPTTFSCLNCHAEIGDRQQDEAQEILDHRVPRDPLLRCAGLLLGLKHMYAQAMPELDKQAALLLAASRFLRSELGPDWHLNIGPDEDD